ncbi:MAG: PhzF family phenazine biosynthesis protein [Actinobacteria bacterium]|nr:PhzF family phenazine biosynthesis protein [Actinomycetota bacterium]
MRLRQYIVDAFVTGPFSGNPAAVCLLDEWIDARLMQAIAAENNLSETAFFVSRDCETQELRWFTPRVEVDLCGHATLASAHVLAEETGRLSVGASVRFETRSGSLEVACEVDGLAMSLPASPLETFEPTADDLLEALGVPVSEIVRAGDDLIVVVESAAAVTKCRPDLSALARVETRCVCVTAPAESDGLDFVARVFAPRLGIDEDPATGSAQCGLAPYWTRRLGVERVRCFQASDRGAELVSEYRDGEGFVTVRGRCATFSRGEIEVS